MMYIASNKVAKCTKEIESTKIVSQLHSETNDSRKYGYYYDITIGTFSQYNWTLFLGQMRIMFMAKMCYAKRAISKEILGRIEGLCRDLWSGNILFNINEAVFIEPALYYGDKEMEILLFDTFGEIFFFREYRQVHTLSENFHEVKVPIYQVYPLLVHVVFFGASYLEKLKKILKRLKV